MNHASDTFGRIATEHRLAAMQANCRGDLFHPHRLAVNIEYLTDQLLAAFSFATDMTAKHNYLRRE